MALPDLLNHARVPAVGDVVRSEFDDVLVEDVRHPNSAVHLLLTKREEEEQRFCAGGIPEHLVPGLRLLLNEHMNRERLRLDIEPLRARDIEAYQAFRWAIGKMVKEGKGPQHFTGAEVFHAAVKRHTTGNWMFVTTEAFISGILQNRVIISELELIGWECVARADFMDQACMLVMASAMKKLAVLTRGDKTDTVIRGRLLYGISLLSAHAIVPDGINLNL